MSPIQYAKLPQNIQSDVINECAEILNKKRFTLFIKRTFDIVLSVILCILISPILLCCVIIVASGLDGPIFFRQKRIGIYGKEFNIIKFRTMKHNVSGSSVTVDNDVRITKAGKIMRKARLDELPQLFNVVKGDMSIVGPRPEVPHYVEKYANDWRATLLVRPGITCRSSIHFADESELIRDADDADRFYIDSILPEKCSMNIEYVKNISVLEDIKIIFATAVKVL